MTEEENFDNLDDLDLDIEDLKIYKNIIDFEDIKIDFNNPYIPED